MNTQPKRSILWLFWLLACTGLVADQVSKYGIFAALYDGPGDRGIQIIPGAFRLTASYSDKLVPDDWLHPLRAFSGEHMPNVNHGALFGMGGPDAHGNHSNFLFTVVSLAAAVAIVFWITRTTAGHDQMLCVSLGLILAGTLGNLYDRLVFDGVRDFLHWYLGVDWPVFNLADCCLVCGAGLLLYQALFLQPASHQSTEPACDPATAVAEIVDVK